MDVEGGCLCGQVRYAVAGEPLSSIVCHCVSCRKASGAPSVGWLTVERGRFRFTAGALTAFSSSSGVRRSFCGRCGTPVLYENVLDPDTLDVTSASLDDPSAWPPTREVWLEHKVGWAATDPARGQYPRDTQGGPAAPV